MIHPLLNIFGLGGWEAAVVLVVVLIVFGVGKLPEIGSGLGKGIRNFKKGMQGKEESEEEAAPSKQVSSSK